MIGIYRSVRKTENYTYRLIHKTKPILTVLHTRQNSAYTVLHIYHRLSQALCVIIGVSEVKTNV